MQTRAAIDEKLAKFVDMKVIPRQYHDLIKDFVCPRLELEKFTKSDFIRTVLATPELMSFLQNLPQYALSRFFRCSEGLISRLLREPRTTSAPMTRGRPKLLSDERELEIVKWIEERCAAKEWPTTTAFKQRVLAALEEENKNITPSTQYFYDLQSRLMDGRFCVKSASEMDPERFAVSKEDVQSYFNELERLGLKDIHPKLIINIDETDFGASKSGRQKPQKVIVPVDFKGSPVFKASEERRFITCLAATTASGILLTPGLIANRQYECDDAPSCSFSAYCLRYFSPKALVSRDIFCDFIVNSIIPYVKLTRMSLGLEPDAPAVVIFDGHKSHLSELLKAKTAEAGILLVLLPPHSSHLLQPLDQVIFRRMKHEFAQFGPIPGLTKMSSSLERVWASYQATDVRHVIFSSWRQTGLVPVVQGGRCVRIELDSGRVLEGNKMNHGEVPNEHSRGEKVKDSKFGALNEDEYLIFGARQCPLCCQPLD